MSRRIVTTQLESGGQARKVDGYNARLIKYIPTDIIAAWTAAAGLIASAENVSRIVLWIVFLVLLVLTGPWTLRFTSEAGKPPAITQAIVSVVAFAVWVFALGGPFTGLSWYLPLYGSLVLIAFTLLVPFIIPSEE